MPSYSWRLVTRTTLMHLLGWLLYPPQFYKLVYEARGPVRSEESELDRSLMSVTKADKGDRTFSEF